MAFGTRKPEATVRAFANSAASFSPAWNARTIGETGSLHREHARPFLCDPTERFHFFECLPHPEEFSATPVG